MAWMEVCLDCFKTFRQSTEDEPVGSLTCTDCPYCGAHRCGVLQQQASFPCLKSVRKSATKEE